MEHLPRFSSLPTVAANGPSERGNLTLDHLFFNDPGFPDIRSEFLDDGSVISEPGHATQPSAFPYMKWTAVVSEFGFEVFALSAYFVFLKRPESHHLDCLQPHAWCRVHVPKHMAMRSMQGTFWS
jgi:hypothetical protein